MNPAPVARIAYNRRPMALERLYLFTFVIYCTTVGTVLVMMPWSPAWDQLMLYLPFEDPSFLANRWARGALTGFGAVHLVWSIHDLNLVLNPSQLAAGQQPPPGSPSDAVADAETEAEFEAGSQVREPDAQDEPSPSSGSFSG